MTTINDWVSLSLLPGLGTAGFWKAVEALGEPSQVLAAASRQLVDVAGLRASQVAAFSSLGVAREQAARGLERLALLGGCALSYEDQRYPESLRQIADPPPVIYVLGNLALLQECCVAVIGSRAATAYGRRIAFSLSEQLAGASLTVVSGLALGIDSEAHSGALARKGPTIAVLGCGLDVVYPKQNRSLREKIVNNGLLVSEYPLGTPPEGFRFPARNRIIAGLSQGVVVVEAARKSGSLITAQLALDYGREVFAVPGQVDSFKSEGAHWLLQQGAKLVMSVESILEELTPVRLAAVHEKTVHEENLVFDLDPDAVALLHHIEPYPQTRDQLIGSSGASAARVSELLLFLELEGLIEMLPGDMVRRVSRGY